MLLRPAGWPLRSRTRGSGEAAGEQASPSGGAGSPPGGSDCRRTVTGYVGPMDKDPLDVDLAIERLGKALPLQLRSAAVYTMAAGAITGFQYTDLAEMLCRFAEADLADARRLTEKIVTLGGTPIDHVEGFGLPDDGKAIVERLIELETETIEALQDIIPATGHTGDSEALEHRLEHMIMRKQEAVDALSRARGS